MSSKLFWVLAVLAIIVLGIIGSKFGGSTGPLKIDGASYKRMESSFAQMLKVAKNDAAKYRKIMNGFKAARCMASNTMGPIPSKETMMKWSKEEQTRWFKSGKAKEDRITMEILDGMTAEEVIKFGEENYEEAQERFDEKFKDLSQ